jgi:hypothetical protein
MGSHPNRSDLLTGQWPHLNSVNARPALEAALLMEYLLMAAFFQVSLALLPSQKDRSVRARGSYSPYLVWTWEEIH